MTPISKYFFNMYLKLLSRNTVSLLDTDHQLKSYDEQYVLNAADFKKQYLNIP